MSEENGEKGEHQESLSEWRARLKAQNSQQLPPSVGGGDGDAIPQDPQENATTEHSTPTARSSSSYDERKPLYHAYANRTSSVRRPLIEQVSNKWIDEKHEFADEDHELYRQEEGGICDLEDETSCPNVTLNLIGTRRFRRMLVVIIALCALVVYLWRYHVGPRYVESWEMKEGFMLSENGTYGLGQAVEFQFGEQRIKTLDAELIPGGEADPKGKRRLVFVGDVHGCKEELKALMKEVGFNKKTDHLILTGDTISKGPDNPGVLDELIHLGATSVRGNHEDRIIIAAGSSSNDPNQLATIASSKGATKDAAILKHLKKHHLDYLHSMPLVLRIPPLPQSQKPTHKQDSPLAEEILVVHAGLVPAVPLEKQDPYFVMNMRSIHSRTHVPSATRADEKNSRHSKPWYDVWNWYNDRLFRRRSIKGFIGFDAKAQRGEDIEGWAHKVWMSVAGSDYRSESRPKSQVVVYGHDSKAGLQIRRWSKGLDSGCVAGGQLTALVLDAWGQWKTVSVECKGYK